MNQHRDLTVSTSNLRRERPAWPPKKPFPLIRALSCAAMVAAMLSPVALASAANSFGTAVAAPTIFSAGDTMQGSDKAGTVLTMHNEGNLSLSKAGTRLWSSPTINNPGAYATFQQDCNLVIHAKDGALLWQSNSATREAGCRLELTEEGLLGIFTTANVSLWDNTKGEPALTTAPAPAEPAAPATAAAPSPAPAGQVGTGVQTNVNPWNGSGSGGETIGAINTFPGPSMPFGMMQWSPDNFGGNGYFYNTSNNQMRGFSLTHASGVGCGTFGDIPILPTIQDIGGEPAKITEAFAQANSVANVGNYGVTFDSQIGVSLTGTTRAGLGQFTFPANSTPHILFKAGGPGNNVASGSFGGNTNANVNIVGSDTITGSATSGNFCGIGNNRYTVYFAAKLSVPFSAHGVWARGVDAGGATANGSNAGGYVSLAPSSTTQTVSMKVAISYVSIEGATANLDEIPGWDSEPVVSEAQAAWNAELGKIEVSGGTTDHTKTFYTNLYHSLLAPNTFSDADGSYLGADGKVQNSNGRIQYTNFSDWDTYRSTAQLQAWLDPGRASDMAQSLVDHAVQSGSLPRWQLAGQSTGVMNGDNSVPLLANLYAWGATNFDTDTALAYMIKGADTPGLNQNGHEERQGLTDYLNLGYVPVDRSFAGHVRTGTSQTLEYAIADFAIAKFAQATGKFDVVEKYLKRSDNWRTVYNSAAGQIEARDSNGKFPGDEGYLFIGGEKTFGKYGFDEGNAEQYTWLVPQNPAGLISAMGGNEAVITKLDKFFTELNAGPNSPYFWAGNEPGFAIPWMYNYAGKPASAESVIRRVQNELFTDSPNGKPGNDDLGAQSAWYAWSAIGLYPGAPGTTMLLVNTPLFASVKITHAGGTTTINAPGASSPATQYIQTMTINGNPTSQSWVPGEFTKTSGTVAYTLAATPGETWGTTQSDVPPSFLPSGEISPEPKPFAAFAMNPDQGATPGQGAVEGPLNNSSPSPTTGPIPSQPTAQAPTRSSGQARDQTPTQAPATVPAPAESPAVSPTPTPTESSKDKPAKPAASSAAPHLPIPVAIAIALAILIGIAAAGVMLVQRKRRNMG